jgi:hypothetical protein
MQKKALRKLADLQLKFAYNKGSENKAADALSRVGNHFQLNVISTIVPIWIQEILNSYQNDPAAAVLLQELVVTNPLAQGYTMSDGIIRHQGRIWIGYNTTLQTKLISSFYSSALGGHSEI